MSGLSKLERLHRWTLDGKRRQAIEIDRLIEELKQEIAAIDERVRAEIETARSNVGLGRALPAYRKMMAARRERMECSIAELSAKRGRLHEEIQAIFNELKSTEQVIANRAQRVRRTELRKEQAASDEIGQQMHRRHL